MYDMTADIQKFKRVRSIKFAIGGFLVGYSGYRFLTIANASPLWTTHPGLAVLAIGIINILKGILSKGDSKITRTIEACIGICAITVGLLVLSYISDTSSKFTWFISLFLIIQGIGLIATGITQSTKSKKIRIPKIATGIGIIATLAGSFFEYHDLTISVLTVLLSINLFVTGMEITMGAIIHKTMKNS